MGFLDRLLGRPEQEPEGQHQPPRPAAGGNPAPPQRSEDEIAVERYQYLLRTAPPETIERVHTEAFAKLSEEQRDLLFRQLSNNVDPTERPADAQPASLATAATRAEMQRPGTLARTFRDQGAGQQGRGGMGFAGMVGGSLLGTVAGYVIGSAIVSSFLPMDGAGADASGSESADAGGDADGDGGGGDAGGGDVAAGDSGGGDFSGGDFGGGDFGGGDFGF
ncbi:hypothetical protein [Marisediminicola senii]|uniref:hypothetical protein n=1 Tax=Marisediminicola senii TaxID=2711233 RepID=UPI0013ED4A1D|nr:hypothetical protein [Marisediminicola senii]